MYIGGVSSAFDYYYCFCFRIHLNTRDCFLL